MSGSKLASEDHLHSNWVTAALALKCTRDGLAPFVDSHVKNFYKNSVHNVIKQYGSLVKCQKLCTRRSLLPWHYFIQSACPCQYKRNCFCASPGNRKPCPENGFCSQFYDEIVFNHRYRNPEWSNTDPTKWTDDYWEYAKCFIQAREEPDGHSAAESELVSLLNICINHRAFQQLIKDIHAFRQCRAIRNEILHSRSMQLTDNVLQGYIDCMIEILQDKRRLVKDQHAQEAVHKLVKFTQGEITFHSNDVEEVEALATKEVRKTKNSTKEQIWSETLKILQRGIQEIGRMTGESATDRTDKSESKLLEDIGHCLIKQAKQVTGQDDYTVLKSYVSRLLGEITDMDTCIYNQSSDESESNLREINELFLELVDKKLSLTEIEDSDLVTGTLEMSLPYPDDAISLREADTASEAGDEDTSMHGLESTISGDHSGVKEHTEDDLCEELKIRRVRTEPKLEYFITDGCINWCKAVGDVVQVNELLATIRNDRTVVFIRSQVAGVVESLLVKEGDTVEYGVKLCAIVEGLESTISGDRSGVEGHIEDDILNSETLVIHSTGLESTISGDRSGVEGHIEDDILNSETLVIHSTEHKLHYAKWLPSSESITVGYISWRKAVGDVVQANEVLANIRNDRVVVYIRSQVAGVVESLLVKEGDTVEYGVKLCAIVEDLKNAKRPGGQVVASQRLKRAGKDDLLNSARLNNLCSTEGRNSSHLIKECYKICAFIMRLSKEIVHVWPAYKLNDVNTVIFVVFTKTQVSLESFWPLEIRTLGKYNDESKKVMYSEENHPIQTEMARKISSVIDEHSEDLLQKHTYLSAISACSVKYENIGTGEQRIVSKPCIVLYVLVKHLIPLEEESFPKVLGDIPVDVREGGFRLCVSGHEYHDNLLMGCTITSTFRPQEHGTLGGFIEHPEYGLCGITCAHVVISDKMKVCLKEKKILNEDEIVLPCKVLQPSYDPEKEEENTIGRLVRLVYDEGSSLSPGVDIAMFTIEQRAPVAGTFPDVDGRPTALKYESGKVWGKFGIPSGKTMVTKFGCESKQTHGSIQCDNSVVREIQFDSKIIPGKVTFPTTLYKQYQIKSSKADIEFSKLGDSGALVFMTDEKHEMRCIGMVVAVSDKEEGEGNCEDNSGDNSAIVTPITAVLKDLDVNSLIPLKPSDRREFINRRFNDMERKIEKMETRIIKEVSQFGRPNQPRNCIVL